MAEADIEPGSVVGGDSRVVRVVAKGLLATTCEVEPTSGDGAPHEAVKLVTASVGKDARFRELFAAEARKLERLESPLIVPISRAGIDEPLDAPYAVMPFILGEPLSTWHERRTPLARDVALSVIEQIGSALAAAHDAGVTHRDLAPESVLVIDDGATPPAVRVLFFGVAKLASEAKRNTTAAMNRPLWMAPEQAETDVTVTPATDVWSLGLLAYWLLTGHLFWKAGRDAGSAMMTLLREVLYDPLPVASARREEQGAPALPPGFDAWFKKACARDRQRRFQHARDAVAALTACFAPPTVSAPSRAPLPAPTPPPKPQSPPLVPLRASERPSAAPPPSLRRRSKRVIVALAGALAAVTLLAVGLIYYFAQRANDASKREESRSDDDDRHSTEKPKKPRLMLSTWADTDCPLPVSSHDPIWGDREAPVTLVAFSSFDCRACAKMDKALSVLRNEYGGKTIRIVWKNRIDATPVEPKKPSLPPFSPGPGEPKTPPTVATVEPSIGPHAIPAALAGQTVFEITGSDGFWRFEASAMQSPSRLGDEDLTSYAVAAGAGRDTYKQLLHTQSTEMGKVADDSELASRAGVAEPPRLFINGRPVERSAPLAKIETMIDVANQEAADERKSGTPADRVYIRLATKNFSPAVPEAVAAEKEPDDETIYRVPVGDSPTQGPKDALVTIVEFGDYQCPFTRELASTLELLRVEEPSDVRLVWKDNPLPQHRRAEPAAELAREIKAEIGQEAFWVAHDRMLKMSELDDSDLRFVAEMAGVDADGAMAALPIFKFKSAIQKDQELAADLEETSTPTLFINGRKVKGAVGSEHIRAVFEEAKARAVAEVQKGTSRDALYDSLTKEGKIPGAFETKSPGTIPKDAPRVGAKKAKVIIQEFGDLQCDTCADLDSELRALVKQHSDKAALVWRNRPDGGHPEAELAAEVGLDVKAQAGDDGFWRFHDKVLEGAHKPRAFDRAALEALAKDAGADPAKLTDALDKKKHKDAVDADTKAAKELGVSTTPLALIGSYVVTGDKKTWRLERAFAKALADAK